MQRIAIWLTEYFIRKGIVPEAEREVYEYGFAITICTIASTLGLLLGQFLGGAVLIAIFYTCQSSGGGITPPRTCAASRRCAPGSWPGSASRSSPARSGRFARWRSLLWPFSSPSRSPCTPTNKYLSENKRALILRSRLSVLGSFAVAAALAALQWVPASIVTAGYLLSALSCLYAKAHYRPAS